MLDVLLIDDEEGTRSCIGQALTLAGHRVVEAADGEEAMARIQEHVYDVAICDVRLPKVDGLTILRRLRAESPSTAVILMTAYATIPDAVASLHEGAFDYVTKPFDCEEFTIRVIGRIAERRALRQELEQARAQLASRDAGAQIIGASPAIVRLIDRIDTLAHSDAPILITGEAGTGKQLVARTLHARSRRRLFPFVPVSCGAFPEDLFEAELFGYEQTATPQARKRREGRITLAAGGTLFLDDVDQVPLAVQGRLLTALREGTVEPIGARNATPIDVRVLSATHQNLKEMIARGTFREDLFYRLNVLDIHIPPLRERRADFPLLFQHFVQRYTRAGALPPGITPKAWALVSEYPFPGNVREFAQAVERAVALAHGNEIDIAHLPPDIANTKSAADQARESFRPLGEAERDFERHHLLHALELAGGRRARAAELLGISRKSLWAKLKHHGLSAVGMHEGG